MTDEKLRQEAEAAAETVGLNNPNCVSRDTFITGYLAHAAKAEGLANELRAEVERLKRELAELQDGKETMSRFLHEKRMSAECERSAKLRAEVERLTPLAHVTGESSYRAMAKRWSAEVDRLKSELVEANACARGSADLACSKGEQITAERERAAKLVDALEKIGQVDHPSAADKTSWIVMLESVCGLARKVVAEYKGERNEG